MCEGYLKDLYPESLFVVKDSESTKPYPIQEDVQIAPVIAPTLKRKNAKKLTISPNTQELPTEKVIPCKIAKKKISRAKIHFGPIGPIQKVNLCYFDIFRKFE